MPPPYEPVSERILEALVARLQSIQAGADYWYTIGTIVRLSKFDTALPKMPAITFQVADDTEDDSTTNGYITGQLRVVLGLHIIDNVNPALAVERLLADVKRAVRVDFSLGNTSLDAHAVSSRRWLVPVETGRAGATLELLIDYRHRYNDPGSIE